MGRLFIARIAEEAEVEAAGGGGRKGEAETETEVAGGEGGGRRRRSEVEVVGDSRSKRRLALEMGELWQGGLWDAIAATRALQIDTPLMLSSVHAAKIRRCSTVQGLQPSTKIFSKP